MANPVNVSCPEKIWTKVATNVLVGNIWILQPGKEYYHTYRLTGAAAPEGISEQIAIRENGIEINSSVGIDVYIYCTGGTGEVRVDI